MLVVLSRKSRSLGKSSLARTGFLSSFVLIKARIYSEFEFCIVMINDEGWRGNQVRSLGGDLTNTRPAASIYDAFALEKPDGPSMPEGGEPFQDKIPCIKEIFAYLSSREERYLPCCEYLSELQDDISDSMRAILIDWLVDVHKKFKLRDETLYLTVNLIDRYLAKRRISRKFLQLVGVASMFIASKIEEIYPPQIGDFVYITDNAYNRQQILDTEQTILVSLDWELCFTSSLQYLTRYGLLDNCPKRVLMLARYFVEESFINYKMIEFTQHKIACSALYLANRFSKREAPWNGSLERSSGFAETDLRVCTKALCLHLKKARNSAKLTSVRRKFAAEEYLAVATLPDIHTAAVN